LSSSWKIGAVSGLIAGIVAGIVTVFYAINLLNINAHAVGYNFWGLGTLSSTIINEIIIVEIPLNIIWCTVLGIIYSKVYDLVPGKGILKGVIFGLIYYLVYAVRWLMINLMYGYKIYDYAWFYYFVIFIPLGLALGISYELLRKRYVVRKEEPVSVKYDVKGGIYPGAIAGLLAGILLFIIQLFLNKTLYPMIVADINFLVSQLGTHLLFNMIWGAVFGVLFVRFYNKIPSKGILKGITFAMILYFFTTFQFAVWSMAYLFYGSFDYGIAVIIAGLSVFIPFGLVLGFLCRKPSE
jgi:hypothetical protein